jgi:hypothetical protein
VIEWVLKDVRDVADPYIDDIIIGTEMEPGMTQEELVHQHYLDVCKVLDQLEEHKLVADKKKTTSFAEGWTFVAIGYPEESGNQHQES